MSCLLSAAGSRRTCGVGARGSLNGNTRAAFRIAGRRDARRCLDSRCASQIPAGRRVVALDAGWPDTSSRLPGWPHRGQAARLLTDFASGVAT